MNDKRCVIVGAGLSGLVAAKELIDVGIDDLIILEQSQDLGGVWLQHAWPSVTLTSSKWITEFGSYPMPDSYPDFPTPEQMVDYLQSFAQHFDLEKYIRYDTTVSEIKRHGESRYTILTNRDSYEDIRFVAVCSGLHGKPNMPKIPGLDEFRGTKLHGYSYPGPDWFQNQRVLCIGLGESGVGISSEISSVAQQTIVLAKTLALAPRVYPYTNLPYDQTSNWQIAKWVKDFQEVVTVGASWYGRLPDWLQSRFAEFHPILRRFPKQWLPEVWAPYRWHGKFWPHPTGVESSGNGNLTRPDAPSDDLFYLMETGKIRPQGLVTHFEGNRAHFEDGSSAEVDAVICNTGYQANVMRMQFPNGWQYCHRDLYRGCLHPDLPNVAFVGFVRPSIGSIPAMAEMQARLVAQVFSQQKQLPPQKRLKRLVAKEFQRHAHQHAVMQARFPHVYAFEPWMDEMGELIGCKPKLWNHLDSWQSLRAYLMGATIPLRFRMQGTGAVKDAKQRYIDRTTKLVKNSFGALARNYMIVFFFYPHVLTLIVGLFLRWGLHLPVSMALALATLFWVAYMTVDVFRFFAWWPMILLDYYFFLGKGIRNEQAFSTHKPPSYQAPEIFQMDTVPTSDV